MKVLKFAILVLVGAAMLYMSWLKWPDVTVDFGREVYVPWRLSEGAVLYRDLAYWNGPLSPYFNSLLFGLFGASILLLELFNLLVIAGLTWLIYGLYSEEGDRLSATCLSFVFLTVFALSQYYWNGNFNFAAPYSHELTHGILISFLAIYLIKVYLRSRNPLWLGAVGLCAGLALLTKIEISLSGVAAVFTGLVLIVWVERPGGGRLLRMLLLFGLGFGLPLAAFTTYLSLYMDPAEALKGIFGSWLILASTDVGSGEFQRSVMGTDDAVLNIKKMLIVASWYSVLLLPLGASLLLRGSRVVKRNGAALCFLICAGLLALLYNRIPWFELFRPLPLAIPAIAIILFAILLSRREDRATTARTIPMLAMAVFSFTMLLKMVLNVHVFHYGFALAMPAVLLSLHALLTWVPRAVERASGSSSVFRSAVVALVVVMAVWHANSSWRLYRLKDYTVGIGPDRIVTYGRKTRPEGFAVKTALSRLKRFMKPGENFAVLPEGVMLNYLSRRENPSGFINFVPSELTMYGEERMLRALDSSAPDYIVLLHKNTAEYGYRYFGRDYGFRIYSWIEKEYAAVSRIGAVPLQGPRFGILILKRRLGADGEGQAGAPGA